MVQTPYADALCQAANDDFVAYGYGYWADSLSNTTDQAKRLEILMHIFRLGAMFGSSYEIKDSSKREELQRQEWDRLSNGSDGIVE